MRRALVAALALALDGAGPADAIINADRAGRVASQVLVEAPLRGHRLQRCGGTVRDAAPVLTAAPCPSAPAGRPLPPGALTVIAGVTSASAPGPTEQRRGVVAVSSDPAFARAGPTAVHDAAILTLDAPLDLDRRDVVATLPIAAPGERARTATFAGWGRTSARRGGGTLREATVDLLAPRACSHFGARFVRASMLCAGRVHADGRTTGGCNGDSGGALIHAGRLLGIASFVGPGRCGDRRFPTVFTRVGAPAINAFLRQPDPLPRPVIHEAPALAGDASELRCLPGRTDGAAVTTFAFARVPLAGRTADPERGVAIAPFSPSDTYLPLAPDIGSAIFCVARAVNAGGAASATSADAVGPAGVVRLR